MAKRMVSSDMLSQFHFLRPIWLLGLLPVLIFWIYYRWKQYSLGNWKKLINPELITYLTHDNSLKSRRHESLKTYSWSLAWLLACLALAGPAWEQTPQPVHKNESAMVILLDLSPSMLSQDSKPSRLVRARFKLIDILSARREGYTALIVYSGSAHVVSPLTEDTNTIISMVNSLEPSIMPEYGSNVEEAVDSALAIVKHGGFEKADLILITDEVASSAIPTITDALRKEGNFRLSVLGIGTPAGAPIPLPYGGFLKDNRGEILIPKINSQELKKLAENNQGVYQSLSHDERDINALITLSDMPVADKTRELERTFDTWNDRGYLLIIFLLPFILSAFRRGSLVIIVVLPLLYPEESVSLDWNDLWQRPDQQAAKALEEGDAAKAQSLFKNPAWKATAAYRAGDYEDATKNFREKKGLKETDSYYNEGNSLARSGDLEAAIEAYERALEIEPNLEDAVFNKGLLEDLLQQQDQKETQNQNKDDNSDQNKNGSQAKNEQRVQDNESTDDRNQTNSEQGVKDDSENDTPQSSEQDPKQTQNESDSEQRQDDTSRQDDVSASAQAHEEQSQQELEQLLRSVPDDPGGLLRAKFQHQARQRANQPRRPRPPNDEQSGRY
jgi:Ca-activated chloride channel family protein